MKSNNLISSTCKVICFKLQLFPTPIMAVSFWVWKNINGKSNVTSDSKNFRQLINAKHKSLSLTMSSLRSTSLSPFIYVLYRKRSSTCYFQLFTIPVLKWGGMWYATTRVLFSFAMLTAKGHFWMLYETESNAQPSAQVFTNWDETETGLKSNF